MIFKHMQKTRYECYFMSTILWILLYFLGIPSKIVYRNSSTRKKNLFKHCNPLTMPSFLLFPKFKVNFCSKVNSITNKFPVRSLACPISNPNQADLYGEHVYYEQDRRSLFRGDTWSLDLLTFYLFEKFWLNTLNLSFSKHYFMQVINIGRGSLRNKIGTVGI